MTAAVIVVAQHDSVIAAAAAHFEHGARYAVVLPLQTLCFPLKIWTLLILEILPL